MKRTTSSIILSIFILAGCTKDQPTSPGVTTSNRLVVSTLDTLSSTPSGTTYTVAADGSDKRTLFNGLLLTPPQGGKMVVLNFADSTTDYCNVDGTGIVHLSSNGGEYLPIGLASGGAKVLFDKFGSDGDTLFTGNPDGSGIIMLGIFNGDNDALSVSPDGKQVTMFTQGDRSDNGSISIVGIDGTNPHVVATNISLESPSRIDWSPDGTRILFAASMSQQQGGDLFTVNADGTGMKNITNDSLDQVCGEWSPDGMKIAFTQGTSNNYDLMMMNADGSDRSVVVGSAPGAEFYPRWSPDGSTLLYRVGVKYIDNSSTSVEIGSGPLRVVNLSSHVVTTLSAANSTGYWIR